MQIMNLKIKRPLSVAKRTKKYQVGVEISKIAIIYFTDTKL